MAEMPFWNAWNAALLVEQERERQRRDEVELAELRVHYASARNAAE